MNGSVCLPVSSELACVDSLNNAGSSIGLCEMGVSVPPGSAHKGTDEGGFANNFSVASNVYAKLWFCAAETLRKLSGSPQQGKNPLFFV